ncbi:MAG: Uma2 family endonuclease [Chloroflexi bacterium]|nr:Uma2 family endonuclease [Chloroflexota bacterium]
MDQATKPKIWIAPREDDIEFPPPLEAGDRLTRFEFERRCEAMPHVKKAELIEGVAYVTHSVTASHGSAHGELVGWLGTYSASTPGVDAANNATVRLDLDNEVQPDALLRLETDSGGHSRITADDYIEGAPELIVEIAGTSAAIDLHDKLRAYRRNGIQEYIVWRVYTKRIDWLRLSEGEYVALPSDDAGVVHSQVFPGLRLSVSRLIEGDLAAVLAELQNGLASPEHAAFIEKLAQAKQEAK